MKPTIYIHIGPHKTGTTNIQTNILKNEKVLNNLGYYYPKSGLVFKGQHNIVFDISNNNKFSSKLGGLNDLETELKNKKEHIIISSETFDEIDQKAPLIKLKERFQEKYNFKIIAYLRRQDELLRSFWKTELITGEIFFAFNPYIKTSMRSKKFLYYDAWLNTYASVFGHKNMVVNIYEKRKKEHFKKFLNCCGLTDFSQIKTEAETNPSFSDFTSIVFFAVKKRILTKEQQKGNPLIFFDKRIEHDLLKKVVIKYIQKNQLNHTFDLYNQGLYNLLVANFKESNQITAIKYFNQKELFPDFKTKTINYKKPFEDFPTIHFQKMIYQATEEIYQQATDTSITPPIHSSSLGT